MREQSTVGSYYRMAPEKRLDAIVFQFDHFPAVIQDYEKDMEEWILTSRARTRQEARGDLGVRIQSGNASISIVEITVDEKMAVEKIVETGKLDEFCRRLYDYEEIRRGMLEIKLMKKDYELLKRKIKLLRPDEKAVFERYIRRQDRSAELSGELAISQDSVRKKMYRTKKKLYALAADSLRFYDDETILLLEDR